ncbi:PCYCGC motif-containing (lipo)protein [Alteribacillus sp. HJP-4]|uniref:PCYCGC motif-containing (lipo)protein n=1 Tax=Alteribacillus sp. HJP-4 TaxID=2775394 RepID=UPI0035CCCDFB
MMKKCAGFLILPMLLIAACGEDEGSAPSVGEQKRNGSDLIETTAEASELPEFLEHTSENIPETYADAVNNKELLTSIPCYCGCGESAGHESAFDCFIDQMDDGAEVVWSDHGMKCGVCLEIVDASVKMKEDGASDKEIRTAVDDYYSEGFAEPTPTPHPDH